VGIKVLNSIKCELYKGFKQVKMYVFLLSMVGLPVMAAIGSIALRNNAEVAKDPQALALVNFDFLNLPVNMLGIVSDFILPVFAAILAVDLVTEEYIHGTIKLPLLTPMKRLTLLLSKAIALLFELAIILGTLLASSYAVGLVFFGKTDSFRYLEKELSMAQGLVHTLASYGILLLVIFSFGMLAFIVAVNLNSIGAAIGGSIGLIALMKLLSIVGRTTQYYLLTTYFNFYSILFVNADKTFIVRGFAVIGLYMALALTSAAVMFNKKDLVY
jgi:ABC-2 type transport system permease protein